MAPNSAYMDAMSHSTIIRCAAFACVAIAAGAAGASEFGAAQGRLLGEAGDSRNRVYWSCQINSCTINIRFSDLHLRPRNSAGIIIRPPTQVWLLKADGSHIPALRETPTTIGAANFAFPASAQEEAFAVVVRIDERLHTWWLTGEPLP